MSGRGQLQVLILDELPRVRKGLAAMLDKLGFARIEQAGDGREGLNLLQAAAKASAL